MLAGNVAIADMLAHNRSVFAFHQCNVLCSVRAGFGELDAQFLQQLRYGAIDEFRTIV